MRGDNELQAGMYSYISAEQRVPADHPLRPLRQMTDEIFKQLSPRFDKLYSRVGRPSIAPERLLRALLLQVLYSVRSERMLMEQLSYNMLFRWFVGLNMDDEVWNATTSARIGIACCVAKLPKSFSRQCSIWRAPKSCCRTNISPSTGR